MRLAAGIFVFVGFGLECVVSHDTYVPGFGGICCFQNQSLRQQVRSARDEDALPSAILVAEYNLATLTSVLGIGAAKSKRLRFIFDHPISCGIKIYRLRYSPGMVADSPGDTSMVLTGLLVMPQAADALNGNISTLVFFHETIVDASKAPSSAFDVGTDGLQLPLVGHGDYAIYGSLWAAGMGYTVLVPDGIGFGAASGTARPYVIAEGYAIAGFNMVVAVQALLPTLQAPGSSLDLRIRTAGYSEGGYAAMAMHAQSYNTTWSASGITVAASYPSGGPYDLGFSQLTQALAAGDAFPSPSLFASVAHGYRTYLGLSSIFASADAASTVASWFAADATSYTSADVDVLMNTTFGASGGVLSMFDASVLAAASGDGTSSAFVDAVRANSLASGTWVPAAGSTVRLCHGVADATVYVSNAQAAIGALPSGSVSGQLLEADECSGHEDCAISCLSHTLEALDSHRPDRMRDHAYYLYVGAAAGIAGVVVVALVVARQYGRGPCKKEYDLIA
eukprot:m.1466876 g.1466876  ORF g.1466876 m.1466876 type:complete len:508 (-) comp25138_c0_seq20:6248-7771(-)